MRWISRTLPELVLFAALLAAMVALAGGFDGGLRAQNPRGAIRGTVQDTSGAVVPEARIVIRAATSSVQREVVCDARGEFRLEDLLPGAYSLTVSAKGFADAQSDVTVIVGVIRDTTVTLKAAALQQSVNVQGQSSSITSEPIDAASVVQQGIVSSGDLQSLPLAHRSFANMAYIAPGTEPVEPSDPTKARITAVSFGGSSGLNVELSVDGGDNSDDYIGGFLQNYSPDAIRGIRRAHRAGIRRDRAHNGRLGAAHHQARRRSLARRRGIL